MFFVINPHPLISVSQMVAQFFLNFLNCQLTPKDGAWRTHWEHEYTESLSALMISLQTLLDGKLLLGGTQLEMIKVYFLISFIPRRRNPFKGHLFSL